MYVFTQPTSGWADETQTAKLTATGGGAFDELGRSVAVSGTTIAAWRAPYATVNGNYGQGAVYLFTRQPVAVFTRLSAAKISVGGHVHDTAVLSGATATVSGSVFYLYYASYGACRADVAAFTRGTRPSRGISAGTVTVTPAAVPRSHNIRFGRARTWQLGRVLLRRHQQQPGSQQLRRETHRHHTRRLVSMPHLPPQRQRRRGTVRPRRPITLIHT